MADTPVFKAHVSAWIVIGGTKLPITTLDVTYAVNRIPLALVELPIGREVHGAQAGVSADTEGFVSKLLPYTPMELWLSVKSENGQFAPVGKDSGFPSGGDGSGIKIFSGYTLNPGFKKQRGAVQVGLALSCVGNLSALANGSQFVNGVYYDGQGGSFPLKSRLGNIGAASNLINDAFISQKDFDPLLVGRAVEQLFKVLGTQIVAFGGTGNTSVSNQTAAFETARQRLNFATNLKLQLEGVNNAADCASISDVLGRQLVSTYANTLWTQWTQQQPAESSNLWQVLLQLGDKFLFSVVPTVNADYVVPLFRGLGGEPFKVIDPTEYWNIEQRTGLLEGQYDLATSVTLMSPYLTPDTSSPTAALLATRVVGYGNVCTDNTSPITAGGSNASFGRMQLLTAPVWLVPGPPNGNRTLKSATGSVPDLFHPQELDTSNPQSTNQLCWYSQELGNKVATALAFDGLYKPRQIGLAGRLRLDIAPGSLLRINTPGEIFSKASESFFGYVEECQIKVGSVDGQNCIATTTFELTHVHTQAEHTQFKYEENPLYAGAAFRGRSLLD